MTVFVHQRNTHVCLPMKKRALGGGAFESGESQYLQR